MVEGEYVVWNFYLNYKNHGTNAKKRTICPDHHILILRMFESEMLDDVHNQEATESYAVRNGGRI